MEGADLFKQESIDYINKMTEELIAAHDNTSDIINGLLERLEIAPDNTMDLVNLGYILFEFCYYSPVLRLYEITLGLCLKENDWERAALCYLNLGSTHNRLGDYSKAIEYLTQSVETTIHPPDKADVDRDILYSCYDEFSNVYRNTGQLRKAIFYGEMSLDAARREKDEFNEADACITLGNCYRNLGDLERATGYYETALAFEKDQGVKIGGYANLSIIYADLGDYEKAFQCVNNALEISRDWEWKDKEASCYINAGYILSQMNNYEEAFELYWEALTLYNEIDDSIGVATACMGVAETYVEGDKPAKGIKLYKKALEIVTNVGSLSLEWAVYNNIGAAYFNCKKPLSAYRYMKRSIDLFERIGKDLTHDSHKISFYGNSDHIYRTIIFTCKDLRKHKEMFEYLERSKSKAFLDIIAATRIKPRDRLEKETRLLAEENKYCNRLREILRKHGEVKNEFVDPHEVDKIVEKLDVIYAAIKAIDPEYVAMRKRLSFSFRQIQKLITR